VTIAFGEPVDPSAFERLDGVKVEGSDARSVRLSAPEPAIDAIVKEAARHQVVDLVSEAADLEEIFLEFYEERDGH
jgi:ABC-2 type transport system ATP-binding protein